MCVITKMTTARKAKRPKAHTPKALQRRILIVDEHPTVRDRLAAIINAERDLVVCGIVDHGQKALPAVKKHKPDLVIMEVVGRRGDRLDQLKAVRAANRHLPILVCSNGPCSSIAVDAMRAGATGYVCKGEAIASMLRTIRTILRGKAWLCHTMTSRLVQEVSLGFADSQPAPVHLLNNRERKVFELLGQGVGTQRIATQLSVTVPTVTTCCDQLRTKLGLRGIRELQCAANRWVESETPQSA